jgi:hypothetical protein
VVRSVCVRDPDGGCVSRIQSPGKCLIPAGAHSLISCSFQVLATLADNAKHNKDGQVDEHGALCHRNVALCPVGAIAMMFFTYFHVMLLSAPHFEPDFTNPNYGEYGHRRWYDYHVFLGEKVDKPMSYDSMCCSSCVLFG